MSFLSQANFPRLWLLFQFFFGGTAGKQRCLLQHYKGQKRVLEIGCSVGIISEVFGSYPDVSFTGIDIDESALAFARKRLGHLPNFEFINVGLSELARSGRKFDYIVFANILHHVDDETGTRLLRDVQALMTAGTTVVVMEPERKRPDYNFAFRFFYLLEKGLFRRSTAELKQLINSAGFEIDSCTDVELATDSMPFLKVGRSTLLTISRHHGE